MKKLLLPILLFLIIAFSLSSCDLMGNKIDTKKLILIDVSLSKLIFYEGDNVKDFLTVTCYYSDGTEMVLSKESYTTNLTNDKIAASTLSVEISYTEGNITKTKEVLILNKNITSLEVISNAENFFEGNNIKDFITVKVLYADGTEKTISKDSYSTNLDDDILSSDTTSVTVSYTENDITKTKNIQVRIKEMIGKDWFSNFTGMTKDEVTSIFFGKKAPTGATLIKGTADISYYKKDNDIYVVGSKLVFKPDASEMFQDFQHATAIIFEDNIDTSRVTTMNRMFNCCHAITDLDCSYFNTSKVTNMNLMFGGCNALESLNICNFDTSKVADKDNMFNMFGQNGTKVLINPNDADFFNSTGLNDTTTWEYSSGTYTRLKDQPIP